MVLPTETPITDPVLIFAFAMLVFLIAPLILDRYRLPGIVGIILVGAVVGPGTLGLLERDDTIVLLGEVGLIYLMFIAGLEIDLNDFMDNRDRSVTYGVVSFLIPQVLGTAVGITVLGLEPLAAVLFASVFASHTLLAYPVVNRLGIVKNEAVTTAIGGTILTDTLALLVLAVVVGAVDGELTWLFWAQLAIGLSVFFAAVWILVPRIGRWFFNQTVEESYFEFLFVMATLFVCAYLAELAGVKHIIGAFLAGLALNRLIVKTGTLMNRIEFVGNALFIPFFLLSVGMLVEPTAILEGPETLAIAGAMIVLVVATKAVSAFGVGRFYDYTTNEIGSMFGLSVGQAAAALAIVLIGFDIGLFDQDVVNGAVLMILVVSVISPAAVRRYGRRVALDDEADAYDESLAPRRVMVPFSENAEYVEEILEFALVLHDADREDPLYAVTVVESGPDAESRTADAEALLDHATEYVSGAEVRLDAQTRIERNVATGIVRAAQDNRITTLVIGWDGERSRRQHTIGSIVDHVVRRSDKLVAVSHIREPVSVSKRVVVILPPNISLNPGFYEAVHTIKRIATGVDAPIEALLVRGAEKRYEARFAQVDPEYDVAVRNVGGWDSLLRTLRDEIGEDDLVVCLSARRETAGWNRRLETLPKSISTLAQDNFVVIYPARSDRGDDRQFFTMK